jgi:phosphate transport system substrate-binding protein
MKRAFQGDSMKTTVAIAVLASALSLSSPAQAEQGMRIEAEAGAAGLLQAAQQDYGRARSTGFNGGVFVNSTSGALAKLCRGEVAAAGAARTATKAEQDACAQGNVRLVELALAIDAVAIVANPQNTWARQVSLGELKKAWLESPGKASSWKQVNSAWPDRPLKLYGPTQKLGLASNYRTALTTEAKEAALALRADTVSTEVLSVVAEGVARDQAALGVLDWATYSANAKRLRLLPVEIDGKAVQPSAQTLRDRSYGRLSYPVILYVNAKSLADPAMKGFLEHLIDNGERLAVQAGLAALSSSDYQEAKQRLGR